MLSESPETGERLAKLTQSFTTKGFTADEAYKLAVQQLIQAVSKQSVLLSDMEIFTVIGYGLLFLVVLLLLNRHLKQTFDLFKNRVWGS